jgi:hypothetical protein
VEILADASNKKPEDVWSCQPYWNVLADATDMTSSSVERRFPTRLVTNIAGKAREHG